jgi:hypothetical protein
MEEPIEAESSTPGKTTDGGANHESDEPYRQQRPPAYRIRKATPDWRRK